jgi:hypothetical protein
MPTNSELLTKLTASNSKVIVYYGINGEWDKTEPMFASVAAPMVATIEQHGGTVRLARFDG